MGGPGLAALPLAPAALAGAARAGMLSCLCHHALTRSVHTAAHRRNGAKVTLFESEASCGGHTLTDTSSGFPVDLGFQVGGGGAAGVAHMPPESRHHGLPSAGGAARVAHMLPESQHHGVAVMCCCCCCSLLASHRLCPEASCWWRATLGRNARLLAWPLHAAVAPALHCAASLDLLAWPVAGV